MLLHAVRWTWCATRYYTQDPGLNWLGSNTCRYLASKPVSSRFQLPGGPSSRTSLIEPHRPCCAAKLLLADAQTAQLHLAGIIRLGRAEHQLAERDEHLTPPLPSTTTGPTTDFTPSLACRTPLNSALTPTWHFTLRKRTHSHPSWQTPQITLQGAGANHPGPMPAH